MASSNIQPSIPMNFRSSFPQLSTLDIMEKYEGTRPPFTIKERVFRPGSSGSLKQRLLEIILSRPPQYLGNHPKDKESNWSDNLQGVTHSKDHWFFTQHTKILKFHVSVNIDTNSTDRNITLMPKELKNLGCNHFGDPDYFVFEDIGYLFVPVEGGSACGNEPRLAVFRDGEQLSYLGASVLPQQKKSLGTGKAGWFAINPINNFLYSSHNKISKDYPVFCYEIDFNALTERQEIALTSRESLVLKDNDEAIAIPEYIQGGCFSPEGVLFISNGISRRSDENKGGIRAFNQSGRLLYKSSVSKLPFKYEYKAGLGYWQEPEGLTYWNLDVQTSGLSAPHIQGQLHAILLNNRKPRNDKIWFKHYRFDHFK